MNTDWQCISCIIQAKQLFGVAVFVQTYRQLRRSMYRFRVLFRMQIWYVHLRKLEQNACTYEIIRILYRNRTST